MVYYKLWVRVELEKIDSSKGTYEDLLKSEPIDIMSFGRARTSRSAFKVVVELLELISKLRRFIE